MWPETDFSDELGAPVIVGSWRDDEPSTRSPSQDHDGQASSSAKPSAAAAKSSLSSALFSPSVPLGFSSHLMITPPASKRRRPAAGKRQQSQDDLDPIPPGCSDADELVEDIDGSTQLNLRKADIATAQENAHNRFHGNSSSVRLVNATRKYKRLHAIESGSNDVHSPTPSLGPNSARRPEFWHAPKVCFI